MSPTTTDQPLLAVGRLPEQGPEVVGDELAVGDVDAELVLDRPDDGDDPERVEHAGAEEVLLRTAIGVLIDRLRTGASS